MPTPNNAICPLVGVLLVLVAAACGGGNASDPPPGDKAGAVTAAAPKGGTDPEATAEPRGGGIDPEAVSENDPENIEWEDEHTSAFATTTVLDKDARDYNREAMAELQKVFEGVPTKCDDGWVYWDDNGGVRMARDFPRNFEVSGIYHPPRLLTEAQRANGVDPQPVEWSGEGKVIVGLSRHLPICTPTSCRFDPEPWQDQFTDPYEISLRKGKWQVRAKVSTRMFPVWVSSYDCAKLPEMRRLFAERHADVPFYPVN